MALLVDKMFSLHKQLPLPARLMSRRPWSGQIAANGRQIDALGYELFGLTEEEIAIVYGRMRG